MKNGLLCFVKHACSQFNYTSKLKVIIFELDCFLVHFRHLLVLLCLCIICKATADQGWSNCCFQLQELLQLQLYSVILKL
ncbi:hypothetical protein T10_6775 [Trichinella papuae]|uniref:Uncharacterized protein n=1 Tax=Trichinella papuae TaxID=268474 RepID=A0A0V1NAM4_9BILA|nr:hypothetical protein T10_6775 [Trichinella papuae]